jgi:polysaccharide biosynthesis protein PslH
MSRDEGQHVIVLANRLPFPTDDGWKTRTYHIIQGLLSRSPATLVTFHEGSSADVERFRRAIGGDLDVVTVPGPGGYSPRQLLLGLVTRTPVYVWNLRSRHYLDALRRVVAERNPDVAVAELTYMYPYLQEIEFQGTRIIDTHNIDSVVLARYAGALRSPLRRLYARATSARLRRFEGRVFNDAEQVWVCSHSELDLVSERAPAARAIAIPNGVDCQYFAPDPAVTAVPGRLLFFGRLDYEPNRDAVHFYADSIMPLLRQAEPGACLDIVGAGARQQLENLVRRTDGMRFVGRVEDLRVALNQAEVVVVPLRMGGGTRLKILEALAAARPVISTTVGAEGLDLVPGRDLLIADDPATFASAIHRLLSDGDLRCRLGRAGREAVLARYDWPAIQAAVRKGVTTH